MEATTTITPLGDASDSLFQPPHGVTPIPNRIPVSREDGHRVLWWGQIEGSDYGEALVRVYVDESGRVRHAELLDADDRSLGPKAISAAKRTVYMPEEVNGKRVPFETTFRASNWSRIDPIRVAATSLQSQGTD
jgi:TonB family protein